MEVPAVGFIEMAIEELRTSDAAQVARELEEFRALGSRTQHIVVPTAPASVLEVGYLLGLETARALLRGMPAAVLNGIVI